MFQFHVAVVHTCPVFVLTATGLLLTTLGVSVMHIPYFTNKNGFSLCRVVHIYVSVFYGSFMKHVAGFHSIVNEPPTITCPHNT